MSDQLMAEAIIYTAHNKHKRQTSMPSAAVEPAIQHASGHKPTLQTAQPHT
jgi:hypothetical protein